MTTESAGAATAGPVKVSKPRGSGRLVVFLFLLPAALLLGALVLYPIGYTIVRSLMSADGDTFVGIDNYRKMFTSTSTLRAIKNNAIWVAIVPAALSALGLIFAVLTERIRWGTAFKIVIFMPMAISFLAAGVTFRLMYDAEPSRGLVNAAMVAVHDTFKPPSPYAGTRPRDAQTLRASDGGFITAGPVTAGSPALLPLVGLPADKIPADAVDAVAAGPSDGITGTVWLDFRRGGGGAPGKIDPGEEGLPGMKIEAVRSGKVLATTTADDNGQFSFDSIHEPVQLRLAASNFAPPYLGLSWLGPKLITPAVIMAYLWIWAGFAMVLIAAGLAAIPRDALEAARVDGATEWQVFRRVTIPLVRPVLVVVFVTLVINVLKIFDLIFILAPESSQDEANVVALEMWRVSFGGGRDYGLGSALGVLLLLLVLPAMLFNLRRFRKES